MSSRKQQKASSRRDRMAAELAARQRKKRNFQWSMVALAAVIAVLAAVVGVNVFAPEEAKSTAAGGDPPLVREDSHRLQEAQGSGVTLVEFLDFECPSCGAMYPVMERLRADYEGEVTFVVRYFPLPMHQNAERAARAVQAAAEQGKFEAMYTRMFETQQAWAGRQVSTADTFRGYARDLGLDMKRYDKAYAAAQTLNRVRKDVADGEKVGVEGTPTFFLDGEKLQAQTYTQFKEKIDDALGR